MSQSYLDDATAPECVSRNSYALVDGLQQGCFDLLKCSGFYLGNDTSHEIEIQPELFGSCAAGRSECAQEES